MYTLCAQRAFSARHFLVGGDWGSENQPHAHSYRVEMRLSAENLEANGYLADLAVLEPILDGCVARFADRLLNDLDEFAGLNPSIEHFARLFCSRLLRQLDRRGFCRVEIRIWENEVAWASYQEAFPCESG